MNVKHLQPGLITAQNIYKSNGALLLGHGIELNEMLIRGLRNLGVESVYIWNPYLDYDPPELIYESTRIKVLKVTRNNFDTFRKTRKINVAEFKVTVNKIIEDVIKNRNALIHLTDIRTYDNYTFGHSINTCLLSVFIGLKMGLNIQQLRGLALGVILHDIGKMLIPLDLLNKKEPLTTEEWRLIREHATTGYNILKETIPLPSAYVALEHHENYDGSGYPQGVKNEEIHQYAQIAAIADIYDATTSDRPYRKAMMPHEAYEVILGNSGVKLNPHIVGVFLENVAIYPVGTIVMLDTNEIGVVTKVYPKISARPIIRIILDQEGKQDDKNIDLTNEWTRSIVKVLKPEEMIRLNLIKKAPVRRLSYDVIS
jgi:HD-GYP domain